jgi:hypothetical protein
MSWSRATKRKAGLTALAAATALTVGVGVSVVAVNAEHNREQSEPHYVGYLEKAGGEAAEEAEREGEGHPEGVVGGANEESGEIATALDSVANARLAPYGSVAAGQYSASLGSFNGLTSSSNAWTEVTDLPYDADDPAYRDPSFSNSSGGAGYVGGRITGLAAGNGVLFAGGANGGVFRKLLGSDNKPGGSGAAADTAWTPISDAILSLSTGDLLYDAAHDTLWYATGEANTGGTSYTGAGVYRLTGAKTGTFTADDRVGGTELESRGINQLKIGGGYVYAASTRGLWRRAVDAAQGSAWQNVLMPNPAADSDITTPYKNMVNDVAIDPKSGAVLANAAWRSGDASYNGFYLSQTGANGTFTRINPAGAINPKDIGNTEFAYAADGSKLYAVMESPALLNSGHQSGNSVLKAVYVSNNGSVEGPWNTIADYRKLGNSGSALKTNNAGKGYGPGVQAWYNNFIEVDPGDADHVYLGLEEVYESTNAGSTWTTPGPYWNFGFSCWNILDSKNTCPETTHSDQHSIAIADGVVFVGNDGGVKARPLAPKTSKENAEGHATDWISLSQGLRTLQYYSVGVGKDPQRGGYAVSGGLQDNGGSLLRGDGKDNAGNSEMVSPFGGDGGDIVVNPKNGCEILDEYVYLTLWMTKNCGQTDGTKSAVFDVSVPDANPRFTAPFRAVRGSQNTADGASERWVAGGNAVWAQNKAFGYTEEEAAADPARGWKKLYTHGGAGRMTVGLDAIASPDAPKDSSKDVIYAAWCGVSNCNSAGFERGVATNYGGTWNELDMTGLPNRYPGAIFIDQQADPDGGTVYLAFNGYNRRFIEGPGAGVQHVFKGVLTKGTGGAVSVAWTDISGNMPDVPATDVLRIGDRLVVGTDYGVIVRPIAGGSWTRVGGTSGTSGSLPLTTVFDLHEGADGNLYAATHGRGIWRMPISAL